MNVIRLVFVAFLLVGYLFSGAQLPFRHYSTNDGLPSSETYSSYQDTKGYIWIATDMGVSRFDGYHFKNYSTADGLADNTVFKFYEDTKGRIWFCSFSGKLSYYYNDSIYGSDMPINEDLRATLKNGYLTGIYCLPNDTLLLGTINGLLKAIPGKVNSTNTWIKLQKLNNKNTYIFNNNSFATIEPQTATSVKLTTYINNTKSNESIINDWYSHLINLVQNPDKSYVVIFSDSSFVLNENAQVTATVNLNSITTVLIENDSHIWLAGRTNGINLYRTENYHTPERHYLDQLTVSGVMRDSENGYWFTTTEDGIFYLPSQKFTWLIGSRDKMPEEKITSINDGPGGTWITAHRSLMVMNQDSQPVYKLLDRTGYPGHFDIYYWNTFYYKQTEIWISTSTGIAIINPITEKLIHYVNMFESEYGTEYDSRMLIADHRNNIWSLNLTTVRCIDATTKKITRLINIPARAQTMCEDFKGNIWVGTLNGVYQFKNDSLYPPENKSIFALRFVDLKRHGNIIAGATRGSGLYMFLPDTTIHLLTSNGLTSNMCRSVFIDSSNTIWLTTNNGVNIIKFNKTKSNLTISHLNSSDGLLSNDVDLVSVIQNLVYLYTKKGLTIFNPDSVAYNNVAPPVYIQQLTIDNIPTDFQTNNTFSHTTNFIGINFIGLTYKNAGKQQYKYQLEGYDTTWTYTTNTFVQFTKLPPGDYRFIVKCINNSGIESNNPAIFPFTINTPFYQKWWFYLLAMLLFVGSTITVSMLYINRVRKQEEQRNETNLKIASLELQAFRAQMNPHFIFNCLNAIQDFIIKNDSSSARRFLTSFAKLIRTTLNNSRRQNVTLDEEVDFLKLYLDLEQMRFNNKFNFRFNMQPGLTLSAIEVPAMILQPFVENAIRHGRIGSLDRQGQLLVSFEVQNSVLICSVDDNGIGYNQSAKNEYQPGNKQAHALDIINDRIKTIAEINKAEIRYTIQDKSDTQILETGTLVQLFIPINQEANEQNTHTSS